MSPLKIYGSVPYAEILSGINGLEISPYDFHLIRLEQHLERRRIGEAIAYAARHAETLQKIPGCREILAILFRYEEVNPFEE